MLRRSSSLVTINLETSNDESHHLRKGVNNVAFCRNSSEDSINCQRNVVENKSFEDCPNGSSESEGSDSRTVSPSNSISNVGARQECQSGSVTSKCRWFQHCGVVMEENTTFSDKFTQRLVCIQEKLQSESKRSYLQTYFIYANGVGVAPFRFNKENQSVVWLKKVSKTVSPD
ncbi:unnamed protein product [Orchesella dallaii]|uniref:Uncharacterized protein n=1 Tax=Orchesella dallaii TaxID=48710 RepID=A0ABP1RY11_9HEXA